MTVSITRYVEGSSYGGNWRCENCGGIKALCIVDFEGFALRVCDGCLDELRDALNTYNLNRHGTRSVG